MRWKKEDIREFVDRDWDAFNRAPLALDATRSETIAGALYEQVREAVPTWPTAADRKADLAFHVHLSTLFARIHDAQRRCGSSG